MNCVVVVVVDGRHGGLGPRGEGGVSGDLSPRAGGQSTKVKSSSGNEQQRTIGGSMENLEGKRSGRKEEGLGLGLGFGVLGLGLGARVGPVPS